MLNFARPKLAKRKKVNVKSIVLETATLLKKMFNDRKIKLIIDANELQYAFVDEDHFKQILLNLLLNAIHAIKDEGTIRVIVQNQEGKVEIFVIDTGKGIEKENLPKIFYPFFTTNTKGTGLGLAVVEQLLHQNNGVIRVESEFGNGTTVKLLIEGSSQIGEANINY